MLRLGSTAARLKLKRIDGDLYEGWNMWFNSIIRAQPYQLLHRKFSFFILFVILKIFVTGAAWLSSARAVKR